MTAKSKARTNLINSIEMFPQNDAAFKLLKDMLIEYIEKDIEYDKASSDGYEFVTAYSQRDFDILVELGMPDTQEPSNSFYDDSDVNTPPMLEFKVSNAIANAYILAFKPNRTPPGVTDGPLLDIGVDV